jgi:hypothetical protein
MRGRDRRIGWTLLPSGLLLVVWLIGLALVLWRGWKDARLGAGAGHDPSTGTVANRRLMELTSAPTGLNDPRLNSLREAAESWRKSAARERERRVIDQVCLVPDVPSFLEALAFWDGNHYFPILLDSPAWSLPFLRAFRPARVLRFVGAKSTVATPDLSIARKGAMASDAVWQLAVRALSRSWARSPAPDDPLGGTDQSASKSTSWAPGLVLTETQCPAFAGAVALAAGRFQSLMRVAPATAAPERSHNPKGGSQLEAVLSSNAAWGLVKRIESQVAAVVPRYDQLGDDCDFLTLAVDWPYRYEVEKADGPTRGIYALDDLVGRRLDGNVGLGKRWAYAGRLVGDPAASVARAMAALFLQPRSALLWNTYDSIAPWSDYDMSRAAGRLRRDVLGTDAVEHRAGRRADLANWHRTFDPVNRIGLVFLNSSGGPQHFAIAGGPGRPADLPRGGPVAVSMIHSYSAADLADPQTIASRWLAQGAYVFYGSVHEPFLAAFRAPALVADLVASGIPFVAALRQGESEAFGFPWRLIYLGDPLYRLEDRRMTRSSGDSFGAGVRDSAEEWRRIDPAYANWRVVEVKMPVVPMNESPNGPGNTSGTDSDAARLEWCLSAAIAESVAGSPPLVHAAASNAGTVRIGELGANRPLDWRSSLRSIQRERLERKLRRVFDELLIDALGEIGADEELQSRLSRIPTAEKSSRVWLAIETCAAAQLARLDRNRDRSRSFRQALDLWSKVIELSWPKGSSFPGQFTERMTATASADAKARMRPWLIRLRSTAQQLRARPADFPHAAVVATELARVEEKLSDHGLRW